MKSLQILLVLAILANVSLANEDGEEVWGCQERHFFDHFVDHNLSEWTLNGGAITDDEISYCGTDRILGGYEVFGNQNAQLKTTVTDISKHDMLRVSFNLFQIDSWDPEDHLAVTISDGDAIYPFFIVKEGGFNAGIPRCGNGDYNDEFLRVSLEIPHFDSEAIITIEDNFTEVLTNESWGINEFKVEFRSTCGAVEEDEEALLGNLCLPFAVAQFCYNHMGLMDDSVEDNQSIDNVCEPRLSDNNEQMFNFQINYNQPYYHLDACFTQEIQYGNVVLEQGNAEFDQWSFDEQNQIIEWQIKLEDFVNYYGCQLVANDDRYVWTCNIALRVYLGGQEQLAYKFKMMTTLMRDYTNELTVQVDRNYVEGDCCENRLEIETELQFCDNLNCDNYLPAPLSIDRKDEFYVEHRIVSPEFQYYYLHNVQIRLGMFIPVLHESNVSTPGRIVHKLSSNVAMAGMGLEVVSRIATNPQFRMLEGNNEITDDENYKLKNVAIMNIWEYEAEQKSEQNGESSSSDQTPIIVALSLVGVISFAAIIGSAIYGMKLRKQEKDLLKKFIKSDEDKMAESAASNREILN